VTTTYIVKIDKIDVETLPQNKSKSKNHFRWMSGKNIRVLL